MKRFGLGVLLAAALTAVGAAQASASPKLRLPTAKHYTRVALKQRFGNTYRHGYAKKLECNHRISRTMIRCKVRWVIGDLSYKGRTRPHYYFHNGWRWKVPYRVKQIDEY